MSNKIKVLIVDDSPSMCEIVSRLILSSDKFLVAGIAHNGQEAIQFIKKNSPNVVLMDIEMPIMSGLEATKQIMEESPLPIVIFSSLSKENSQETIKALALGVVDFILKPNLQEMESTRKVLHEKLELASWVKVISRKKHLAGKSDIAPTSIKAKKNHNHKRKIVVIGASTGGPSSLNKIFPLIPVQEEIPITYFLIQHMPPIFTKSFAENLNKISKIKVTEAVDFEEIENNHCYLAPGAKNLIFDKSERIRIINPEQRGSSFIPNIDIAMKSISEVYGNDVIGVIMTGIGNDGLDGMRSIKKNEGICIVQDEKSSVIYGMPKACIDAKVYDRIVSLEEIPSTISHFISNSI